MEEIDSAAPTLNSPMPPPFRPLPQRTVGILRRLAYAGLAAAFANAFAGAAPVRVLYAGSLVNLMERGIGPQFDSATGESFAGYAGGSNQLANEIKGRLRPGDVFISASPQVDRMLMGAAGGEGVDWYVSFAESPLVLGYNAGSRFASDFTAKPWYAVLAEPGIRIGRTDPKLDPKGRLTLELLRRAAAFYRQPDLSRRILGPAENPDQVLPEEELVGRLQSGLVDAGFFYSTETAAAGIPAVPLPAKLAPKAIYTITILAGAPNPNGAEKFLTYLLGPDGRAIVRRYGLTMTTPTLNGNAAQAPAAVRALLAR